jgi:hypothetical protein
MLLNKHKFYENGLSDSRTLLEGVNKFIPVVSTVLD